jgi:ATP-dependent DNA helicase DinG
VQLWRKLSAFDVLGEGGLASQAIEGFEARPSQLEMAEAVLDRLLEGGAIAVEAPTGVGKTLAYLVPAVLSGRKVVISTHTKTLQDQVIDKDLPRLAKILELAGVKLVPANDEQQSTFDFEASAANEVRYALMKGRSNYLCLDRLDRKRAQGRLKLFEDDDTLAQVTRWAEKTKTGDRAELTAISETSPLWAELDARAEICTGQKCARYQECFVLRMRRRAQNAELIIVNHHLLLADLALRAEASMTREGRNFGEVIPLGDALIIDEAHALEEIASEYFGGRIGSRKLEALARDLSTWTQQQGPRLSIELALTQALVRTEAVFAALPRVEGRVRLRRGAEEEMLEEARTRMKDADGALLELATIVEEEAPNNAIAESIARRARTLRESMRFVLDADDADYVYWTERQVGSSSMGASPIDVSKLLHRHLFEVFGVTVMTSATLAAGAHGARYFLRSIGAPEDTFELVLGTPFDFARQAALYLPSDAPDPDSPDAVSRLVRIGRELINLVGGGALFLFTSYRVMRLVHAQLKLSLKFPVLMQGERNKRELLRMFVERAPCVLFATASFWEGVDIPGDPLRLVLIDRLPFGSPGDPLVAARAERIEAKGDSAFSELHLPRAILRLKQGFGRLVRSKSDRGVVAILDRRVQTRGYGKLFLRALPEASRISDPFELARWLEDGTGVEAKEINDSGGSGNGGR